MNVLVLPAQHEVSPALRNGADEMLQVSVHLQATVMTPGAARHRANVWLSMNAGHLLLADNPELVLCQSLEWRFDVVRSLPLRSTPGAVQRNVVGRVHMDAVTGAITDPEALIAELTQNADALTLHTP
jgi:hypothetical protein